MRPLNPTIASLGTTIFTKMSALATEHKAINLGQGFPDDAGPADVLAAAADAVLTGFNQYPPMAGLPELRQAIAAHEARFYGLTFDWRTETLVTSGATEALAACFLALLSPGDEAVVIQPAYDSYAPMIRRAGATPRFVSLHAPDFHLDLGELEAAFSPKTKLLVLNNPQNPSGKVFGADELDAIGKLAAANDAYVICDEVYEHLLFDGKRHVPLISRPGMRERCLKLGSAGKSFSLTGWKVGMIVGPAPLVSAVAKAHQFLTFTTPPNLQVAVAVGLNKDDAYFEGLQREMQRRRDRLAEGLRACGLSPVVPDGTYFMTFDLRQTGFQGDDVTFCEHLVKDGGVAAIPLSAFYEDEPERSFVRLCFAKQDSVIDAAVERLAKLQKRSA